MDTNITYHWTNLDYANPVWYNYNTWGPVAEALITVRVEILNCPNCRDKTLSGVYKRLSIPIEKGTDPKHQIIQAIKKFGEEEDIKIKFDFIKKWEEKNPDLAWE